MRRLLPSAAVLLLAVPTISSAQESTEPDVQLLKAARVATDTAALLRLLDQRSLRDADRTAIEGLVRQLDSQDYDDRQHANAELAQRDRWRCRSCGRR